MAGAVFFTLSFLTLANLAVGIQEINTGTKSAFPNSMLFPLYDRPARQEISGENAIISIFGEGEVEVFVNAYSVLSFNGVSSPRRLHTVHLKLSPDDVIAVSSSKSGNRYGLLMSVQYEGNNFYAGRSSKYKSEGYKNQLSKFYDAYKMKAFRSCSWGSLEHVSRASIPGISDEFGFVWKKINGGPAQQILIRFSVRSESCDSSPVTCSCRKVSNSDKYCYRIDGNAPYGKCRKELCEKYECVSGGVDLLTCIRRFADFKTVKKGRYSGYNFCKKESTPRFVYWVPYV